MTKEDSVFEIIVDECLRRGINPEYIEYGCEHAEFLLDKSGNFSASILSGIAVAEGLHKRAQHKKLA